MKFIGAFIQNLVARFKNDVYLEDIAAGTIASGGNLGLDSNNKIVKAAEVGSSVDLTSEVTGILPVANGGTGLNSISTLLNSNTTKSDVDLGNVENTALSTYTGNGGALDNQYIANGAGYTTNTGTISSIRLATDDSNVTNVTSGSVSWVLAGGTGIDTSQAQGGTFTVAVDASEVDHDSLLNFVAEEHYRWDTDISGTATINAANIPTLNQNTTGTAAGLSSLLAVGSGGTGATSLTSNSILTGNGTSAIQAESTLSYDSEILDIGADDEGAATIRRLRHTDEFGGDLYVRGGDATGTDKNGGNLQLFGGRATGSGAGGGVIIQAGETNASSSTALRGTNVIASFRADGDTLLQGNLIFEGSVPDVHETTFSITNPTGDRTITVPDEDVDLGEVNHHFDYLHINLFMSAASANQYMSYGGHYNFNIGATAYSDGGGVVNKNSSKWSHYQAITACSIHTVMYNFTDTGGGSGDDYVFELWEIVPGSGSSDNTTNLLKQYSITGNASANYLHTATDTTGYALAAGSQLLPVIRKNTAWSGTIFGDITIKFRY